MRLPGRFLRIWEITWQPLAVLLAISLLLGSSSLPPGDRTERVRAFTRQVEFDYVQWTLDALQIKFTQAALGDSDYITEAARKQIVLDYLDLVGQTQRTEWEISLLFTDPNTPNPQQAAQPLRHKLEQLRSQRDQIAPLAESILQSQVSYVTNRMGLTLGGQPTPPVLYHSTPLPLALIVSPREVIRQDESISLLPDLTTDQRAEIEERVDHSLNVSSLVVDIGGVGTYPTMVQQTSSLAWLSEVVSHEWVHNYLTLRPLGINYLTSPALRVMNETTASIAGKEIGRAVLEQFYPELLPPPSPQPAPAPPKLPEEPPAFDFRKEMNITRVTVDQLLAEGKVEEAEAYMEARRQIFWEQGYHSLRKLNQAYFAFYGAYADEPGGASGASEDPVGTAVRALRAQSPSLTAFINRMSWFYSFEQLQQAVSQGDVDQTTPGS
ncbi:MAG: hypothetical protein AB1894_02065 [Chloroflexota bacterium]